MDLKENLVKKLEDLKNQKEQAVANLNAIAGAVAILEQLVKESEEKSE